MAGAGELADWELLQPSSPSPNPHHNHFDVDDAGAIHPDYFSLSPAPRRPPSEPLSDDSDRPSWLDPDSNPPDLQSPRFDFCSKNPAEFWSDGSSSAADSDKGEIFRVFDQEIEVGLEGIGESLQEGGRSEGGESEGKELDSVEMGGGDGGELAEKVGVRVGNGDGDKKVAPWWKLPIEVLKFYVLRVRPFWSVSIAAAIIGILMLGRRLYRMKQKSRSASFKVSLDEKKASLFTARAARLNEALSVVRRAPIIRPSLPAGGVTPWPALAFSLS